MGHGSKKWYFLFFFLLILTFYSQSCLAAESIEIISPQKLHFAGQPILFHIQTKNFYPPREASLFYRDIGSMLYRKIPMKKETAIDFRAMLKSQKVTPPGIEFYFVVQDGKGRIFTFPKLDPKKKPYALKVDLDKRPPHIVKSYPSQDARVQETRPVIKITFEDSETRVDKNSVRLVVDDTDVTQLAMITEKDITYEPATGLVYGRHSIGIEMVDVCGNRMPPKTWEFFVPQGSHIDNSSVEIRLDKEYRHQIATDQDNLEPDWKTQCSGTLNSLLESGDLKTSFDANVWYINEQGSDIPRRDRYNLNNFIYQLQYGGQSFAAGDINVQGTELISQSISRRGTRATVDIADTKAEAFALRSNYITGFRHGLGVEDPDQRLTGGSIQREILKNKKLNIKLTYVKGKDIDPDNYYMGTLQGGTEGNIYSVAFDSQLFNQRLNLEGEFSGSRFDSDVSDSYDEESDKAWRAKVSGRGSKYDWGMGYKYLGPDFRSVVIPTGANDREEYSVDGGLMIGSNNLRMSLMHSRDNVDKDSLYPVIRNSMGTISYNLSRENWPSMFMNYSLSLQDSTKEPAFFSPMKNQTQTIGGGLSVAKPRWNVSPTYTFTTYDDKSTTNYDSDTHVVALSGGLRPTDNLSINPSLSYTNLHYKYTNVTAETYQGALGSVVSFFSNAVNFNTTLSMLDNKTSDGLSHTTTYNLIGQLNWHLEKYLLKRGGQTLSVRGQYSQIKDHVQDSRTENYTIYGVFSLGVPIKVF